VADALVIGYGNDLRTDDGAGRWVADQIDGMALGGVEVRSVAQLTPELALAVSGRSTVVFVDASVDATELTIERVEASGSSSDVMTHHGNPATLLSMVPRVGEMPAEAWIVSIPATDLSMGFEMTVETREAAEAAVAAIIDLVS
jgi:hydrogenase maturation protease